MWLFLNVLYVTYCVLCSKVLNSAWLHVVSHFIWRAVLTPKTAASNRLASSCVVWHYWWLTDDAGTGCPVELSVCVDRDKHNATDAADSTRGLPQQVHIVVTACGAVITVLTTHVADGLIVVTASVSLFCFFCTMWHQPWFKQWLLWATWVNGFDFCWDLCQTIC